MTIVQQLVAGLGIPNFKVLIPEIIVLITAILVFLAELFIKSRALISALTVVGLALAAFSMLTISEGAITLYGLYIVDSFSLAFKFFLVIFTILAIINLQSYVESKKTYYGEYYYLILFTLLGLMIIVSSPNLISFYIGLELSSITSYILVGLWRKDYRSKEGAFKYLIIGGAGTAIISYAIALIYGKTGSFDFARIFHVIQDNSDIGVTAGLVLLLVGLGLKASAVPFHFWTPDAYESAPTPITGFMASVSKVAIFAAILRIMVEAFPFSNQIWSYGWAILAAASMILGNFVALKQKNVKRMLAYSSIAHSGYILAALASPNGMGFTALIFYSIVYLFMALGGFIFLSAFEKNGNWTNDFEDFKGLAKKHPIMALYMLIYMFSMIGIPPTVGFMGKFGVFMALISSNVWWLAVILVITSVVSAGYYLKVVAYMYMYEPVNSNKFNLTTMEKFTVGFLAVLVLVVGIYPTIFWEISNILTSVLIMNAGVR
ncbi:MAG: NADH-quinone oxidoreductase subunit N [Sulfurihydrogenibium sp.]|uniref:NADH-quinone oxidoreductase subunit N n=1 Tax=Sulfurihydrogenibium sp. TaxID=2053621 RepID=UPI003D0D165C